MGRLTEIKFAVELIAPAKQAGNLLDQAANRQRKARKLIVALETFFGLLAAVTLVIKPINEALETLDPHLVSGIGMAAAVVFIGLAIYRGLFEHYDPDHMNGHAEEIRFHAVQTEEALQALNAFKSTETLLIAASALRKALENAKTKWPEILKDVEITW